MIQYKYSYNSSFKIYRYSDLTNISQKQAVGTETMKKERISGYHLWIINQRSM